MFQIVKEQYLKYKEIINYLIFGGVTTVINFAVYVVLAKIMLVNEVIANVMAWIISVIFAYITNRVYVFESKNTGVKYIIKEFSSFIGCRIFSGIIDMGSFWLLFTVFKINDIVAKIIIAIIVVILNYLFSKLIIFKSKKEETLTEKEE